MAGYKDCIAAIVQRFDAGWTTTAKVYDNLEYTSANDTDFVYLSVTFTNNSQNSMANVGSRLFRASGVIEIDIFTAINQGVGKGAGYADTLAALFRGVTFSNVLCKAPLLGAQRKTKLDSGNYWRTPLFIPFQYDARF